MTAPTAVEAVENKTRPRLPRRPLPKQRPFHPSRRRWFDLVSPHILQLKCSDAVGLLARVTGISG